MLAWRSAVLVPALVLACSPVWPAPLRVEPTVQMRMLELIRESALKSTYAQRQAEQLAAVDKPGTQAAVYRAAAELKKLGLRISFQAGLEQEPQSLVADWPGRSLSHERIVIAARFRDGDALAADVAAAMGVVELFNRLQMKPRRTVRVVAWSGQRHAALRYRDLDKGGLADHVALIESDVRFSRPAGIAARVTPGSLRSLDPLRAALRPIGSGAIRPPAAAAAPLDALQGLGIPTFAPFFEAEDVAVAATTGAVSPDTLRQHVAMLAALTWLLGEMPEALPRLPQEKGT